MSKGAATMGALVLLVALLAVPADAQTFEIFAVPGGEPSGITSGPDGALWFLEKKANKVGRITTAGAVTEFPIPDPLEFGSVGQIVAGRDGNLWFTEDGFFHGNIWRLSTHGAFRKFPLPDGFGPEPTTVGPDGNVWFGALVFDWAPSDAKIGRISPAGDIHLYSVPRGGYLNGMTAGPDGAVWFTETRAHKIGRITVGGAVTEFEAGAFSSPKNIVSGPDGALWFSDPGIRRMTTSGTTTTVGPRVAADAIVAGPDGALWLALDDPVISRMTTSGSMTKYPLPTASRATSLAWGPDGALWFTGYFGIGRMTRPCESDGSTLCLHGGRFQTRAAWKVESDGTSGSGTAVPLTDDTGYFWFFSGENVEVLAKVVDGCSVNSNYWVFAGGLTNVEVRLAVTDMDTGEVKTYVNPANTAFQPIQDTAAFASCR